MMRPLLQLASDGAEHTFREAVEFIAQQHQLTTEDRSQRMRNGQPLLDNRAGWARTYLVKAGLLESPRRGVFRITERGRAALASGEQINNRYLRQYPEFTAFVTGGSSDETGPVTVGARAPAEPATPQREVTPEEMIESGYDRHNAALAEELRQKLLACSPEFFEQIVIDLLVKMGYGGSVADAGRAVGRSGDQGIDGLIKEDKLGLDTIYVQAKRWATTVGRPEIQQFTGALHGQHARKGVFLTTSSFSQDARDYVARIDVRIVLIDGQELARLMIQHGVGVTTVETYELKRLDSDYFSED